MSETPIQIFQEEKDIMKEYAKAKQIYNEYVELRRKLGFKKRLFIDIEEIKENLKSLGAIEKAKR